MGPDVDLTGRVALVTGASRGIGRAIALALADAGSDVVVNCRERAQAAQGTADAIRAKGRRALAIAIAADVVDARRSKRSSARSKRNSGRWTSWSATPGWRSRGTWTT